MPFLAHMLVVGNSSEIYRLDLCEGRFYAPLNTRSSSINSCGKRCYICTDEFQSERYTGILSSPKIKPVQCCSICTVYGVHERGVSMKFVSLMLTLISSAPLAHIQDIVPAMAFLDVSVTMGFWSALTFARKLLLVQLMLQRHLEW